MAHPPTYTTLIRCIEDFALFERYDDSFRGTPYHQGIQLEADTRHAELEVQMLLFSLVLAFKPKVVTESGCHVGVGTIALAAGCRFNGYGVVFTCDTDLKMVEVTKRRTDGLPVEIAHGPALAELPLYVSDLHFADGAYESRLEEIKKLKSGAVAILHDTLADEMLGWTGEFALWDVIHCGNEPRGFAILQKG